MKMFRKIKKRAMLFPDQRLVNSSSPQTARRL